MPNAPSCSHRVRVKGCSLHWALPQIFLALCCQKQLPSLLW